MPFNDARFQGLCPYSIDCYSDDFSNIHQEKIIMKTVSTHQTESEARSALDRLEKKQARKPEHKRNLYTIDRDIFSGQFNVINWGS